LKNEYMLVDAKEIPNGTDPTPEDAAKACPANGTSFPTAYELTGSRENEIAEYVGKRIVLTGTQEAAKVRPVGTSGVFMPTGGFDPLGHELHLFEVEAETFHDVNATLANNNAPAPAPAPAPEATEAAAPPAPEPAAEPEPTPAPEPNTAAVETAPPSPPAPVAEAPAEQPPQQVAQAELPRTASPLPLIALIGLLSLGAGAGMRLLFGRE
jgi:hypothetical protein